MTNDSKTAGRNPIERIYQELLTRLGTDSANRDEQAERDEPPGNQDEQAEKQTARKKSGKIKAERQIERLYKDVQNERNKSPKQSKTAKLFAGGRTKIAKKVVEEAAEVSLDCMTGDREGVIRETADLLYNIVVLMVEMDIHPRELWREMDARANEFGIAEKLPKTRRKGKGKDKYPRSVSA